MTRKDVYKWEQELIFLLNLSGWQINWSADPYCHYDSIGYDKQGSQCVMEFKFRRSYYKTKILEKKKYNWLKETGKAKLYYVAIDAKGCWIYDLDNIHKAKKITLELPKETITDNIVKEPREVYELKFNESFFYDFNFF